MKRLPYLFIIGLVLFCGTAVAKTPDGETPANEGVCDDLMYATPGLYGLCVAFCEAQDCEPNFSLDNPFENCRPSSEKLLRNYERKMQEGDPPMPCIMLPPSCPCWTAEELAAFPYVAPNDVATCDTISTAAIYISVIPDSSPGHGSGLFTWQDGIGGAECGFATAGPNHVHRYLIIDMEAYWICYSQALQAAADRNIECIDLW